MLQPSDWIVVEDITTEKRTLLRANAIGANHKVLANLGTTPPVGLVYGVRVEPFQTESKVGLLQVNHFTDLDKEEAANLKKALEHWQPLLQRLGFFPTVQVRAARGRTQGSWGRKGGKFILNMYPLGLTDELTAMQTVVHEIGHGVWDRKMSPRMRARWIKAYHEHTVSLETIDVNLIKAVATLFQNSGMTASKFLRKLKGHPDKEKAVANVAMFKRMLRWTKVMHRLSKKDLNTLAGNRFSVAKYFPIQDMISSRLQVTVTGYATKNPVEYWCESFAMYMTGFDDGLPPKVLELMQGSLRFMRLTGLTGLGDM